MFSRECDAHAENLLDTSLDQRNFYKDPTAGIHKTTPLVLKTAKPLLIFSHLDKLLKLLFSFSFKKYFLASIPLCI